MRVLVIGMALPLKLSRRSLVSMIGCGMFTVSLMLFWFTDFSPWSDNSDFSGTFWLSSKLMLDGHKMDIYPPTTSSRLLTAPQNVAAHKILTDVAPSTITSYFYPPMVAGLYLPLAYLPVKVAYFVFQIVSIISLIVSCRLLCGTKSPEVAFFSTFLFTPMVVLLWVGQSDMNLVILPYCLMYWFLSKDKPMAAGMAGSISLLKTNLALVPGFIAMTLLLRKQWRMFAGFCLGGIILAALNILIFSPEMCHRWVVDLTVMEADFADPKNGAAAHMAASLQRMLLFAIPHAYTGATRLWLAISGAVFGLIGWISCLKLTKNTEKIMDVVTIALVVSSCILPMCAQYLFFYDLSVLAVAGILVYTRNVGNPEWTAFLRSRFLILWIILDFYPLCVGIRAIPRTLLPLFLVVPFSVFYLDMLRFIWLHKTAVPASAQPESPASPPETP